MTSASTSLKKISVSRKIKNWFEDLDLSNIFQNWFQSEETQARAERLKSYETDLQSAIRYITDPNIPANNNKINADLVRGMVLKGWLEDGNAERADIYLQRRGEHQALKDIFGPDEG